MERSNKLSNIASYFTRTIDKLSYYSAIVSGIFILLIIALVCSEVIARTFFSFSIMICDEMSGYLNAGLIFLGLSYTLREGGFLRVEMLYGKLKGRSGIFTKCINTSVALFYTCILLFYFWRHVWVSYDKGVVSVYPTATPLYVPQGIAALGGVILGLKLLSYLINRCRGLP